MEQQAIITVKDLRTYFYSDKRCNKVLNGVSFELYKGRTLCVVGESGCGKSVTASSIMQLLPKLSRIESGAITYHSEKGDIRIDQLPRNGKEMRALRGRDIAMIFQDPMTALNPVLTVGSQIEEALELHNTDNLSKAEIEHRVEETLQMVGIPKERKNDYPYQFSGGMRQRVVIAMALVCNPDLLIADEPTTALDVTIQAQILSMICDLQRKYGTSVIMITHDLGVVAETCDKVGIIYAGETVEYGSLEDIFTGEKHHPYTKGLFGSIPNLEDNERRLHPIEGLMPDPTKLPDGCAFADRCKQACEVCHHKKPAVFKEGGHSIRCHLYTGEIADRKEQEP